jgi:hypothetical protein
VLSVLSRARRSSLNVAIETADVVLMRSEPLEVPIAPRSAAERGAARKEAAPAGVSDSPRSVLG